MMKIGRNWLPAACCLLLLMSATGWPQDADTASSLLAEPAPETTTPESEKMSQPGETAYRSKSPQFYFEFLEFRYDLHRRVLDRWQNLVRANRNALSPGTIQLKYYINDAGFISVIEKKPGSWSDSPAIENAHKLGAYALALENKDPVPFPESVKRVYPKGYFYQISLVVR